MDISDNEDQSEADLEATWAFNFLCCYNTRDGDPRSHQAWQPSQEPAVPDTHRHGRAGGVLQRHDPVTASLPLYILVTASLPSKLPHTGHSY